MKRGIRLFLAILMLCSLTLGIVACKKDDSGPGPNPDPIPEPGEYQYDGTLTKGPYVVYNQDGSREKEFDNMFLAIQYAGQKSLSSNKMYVLDSNDLKIFQRQAKNQCFMFDGEYYVGIASESDAKEWGLKKSRSYVYNGWGQGYVQLGRIMFEGSATNVDIPFEIFSGAYNYMYSKSGELVADEWVKQGFGYFETTVRLSEAHYMPSQDGEGWNAYVFINVAGKHNCDLGVIGNLFGDEVRWRLCRNCSHPDHQQGIGGPGFNVINPNETVTTMKYNEETKDYTGADDLKFQVLATKDTYKITITNLTTNKEFVINEEHIGSNNDSTQYLRFLLAASYCPVVGNAWNARSGAYLKDVIFEDSHIARYNDENNYPESTFEEFYPGADSFHYGFTQGADCASALFGIYDKDGTYANGATYKKGMRWINFSSFYDGSHHNSK